MAVEMAIWRMTDAGPQQLASSPLDSERRLEDMLIEDPSMSGTDLLILGRQVLTSHGGFIDLLALDADGRAHVLELKRDRTPRDVVAQALDYGSWVEGLSLEDLEQIYLDHQGGNKQLDEAFAEQFDSPLPDVVNAEQQFTIIASELDPTSERIVEFLAEGYGYRSTPSFFATSTKATANTSLGLGCLIRSRPRRRPAGRYAAKPGHGTAGTSMLCSGELETIAGRLRAIWGFSTVVADPDTGNHYGTSSRDIACLPMWVVRAT